MIEFSPRSAASVPLPSAGKYRLFMTEDGAFAQMDDAGTVSVLAFASDIPAEIGIPSKFIGKHFLAGFIDGSTFGPSCRFQGPYRMNAGAPVPTLDNSANGTSLAIGATIDFPLFSGVVIANDWSSGAVTIYSCGGGGTSVVNSLGTQVGTMAFNSGANAYRFTNNTGAARVFSLMAFKTRAFT